MKLGLRTTLVPFLSLLVAQQATRLMGQVLRTMVMPRLRSRWQRARVAIRTWRPEPWAMWPRQREW